MTTIEKPAVTLTPERSDTSVRLFLERIILLLVFTPLGLGLLSWGTVIVPAFRSRAENQVHAIYAEIEHPPDSAPVGSIGSSAGDDTCVLGELRQYTGERAAVEAFYSRQGTDDHPICVTFLENGAFIRDTDPSCADVAGSTAWPEVPADSDGSLYLVYVLDSPGTQ